MESSLQRATDLTSSVEVSQQVEEIQHIADRWLSFLHVARKCSNPTLKHSRVAFPYSTNKTENLVERK